MIYDMQKVSAFMQYNGLITLESKYKLAGRAVAKVILQENNSVSGNIVQVFGY